MDKTVWLWNTQLPVPFQSINCLQRGDGYRLESHRHSFWQIILVTEGILEISTAYSRETLSAGWMHILPPGMDHSLFSPGGYSQLGIDLSGGQEVSRLVALLEDSFPKAASFFLPQGVAVSQRVLNENLRGTFLSHTRILNLLEGLILDGIALQEPDSMSRFAEKLLDYLRKNLHRTLRLEEIAAAFSVSAPHLERLCRRSFHNGVISQLQKLRLELAQQLLLGTDLPIQEIGARVGYSNPSQFSVFFKTALGISPKNYRIRGMQEEMWSQQKHCQY